MTAPAAIPSRPAAVEPTDYAAIYDRIIAGETRYQRAEGSPGLRVCLTNTARLRAMSGPALDVGCGVGFAAEYLSRHMPWGVARSGAMRSGVEGGTLHGVYACDVSAVAVEHAGRRLGTDRVRAIRGGEVPFPDRAFGLVTCFDVMEHLDEPDVFSLVAELRRVARPGGWIVASVSLRPAQAVDHHGTNAHRTVRPIQWWIDAFDPDEASVDCRAAEAVLWRRIGSEG